MFDRLDRNQYIFRDTGLEEAVRSAIIQMDKMADDYLRDYLAARGFILVTPEPDADLVEKVAYAIFREHDKSGEVSFAGGPRKTSLAAARAALAVVREEER